MLVEKAGTGIFLTKEKAKLVKQHCEEKFINWASDWGQRKKRWGTTMLATVLSTSERTSVVGKLL